MLRTGLVTLTALLTTISIIASQQGTAFRVSTAVMTDVRQQTLQEVNPDSKQAVEVFPGKYVSPYGAQVMKRIEEMLARVDEADRNALVQRNIGAGFDRAITSWRAHSSGRAVALAVHYYRDHLLTANVALSDDYGRPEPIVTADYQFRTVAVCSRAESPGWSCREELLAAVAKRHNVTAVETLLELVLAEKKP